MTEELQELGLNVGHRRVGRLMQANGIKIVRTRKYKATTDSNHAFNIAPNLLDQDFSTNGPNQKWAGDISCIWTSEGGLYLAVIIDLYSRRVIGWATSNRMKRDSLPGRRMRSILPIGGRSGHWIWQWPCANRPRAAFTIRTAVPNIAPTRISGVCQSTASRSQ